MKNLVRFTFLLLVTMHLYLLADSLPYKNILYYADYSVYTGQNNFYPSDIDANLISHLIFDSVDLDSNGDLVLLDEYADFQIVALPELEGIKYDEPYGGVLGAISVLKVKYPHLKIGVSVGGKNSYDNFYEVARNKFKRKNFAYNIAKFVDYLGYDFVDVDWRYQPEKDDPDYSENLVLLLKDIREELNAFEIDQMTKELSIKMTISPIMKGKIKFDQVLEFVNFTNVMTYDLNGPWNSYSSHQSPLYTNKKYNPDTMPEAELSVDSFVTYLEKTYGNLIDMGKIVIGVAPYTRGWGGVKDDGLDKNTPGLYATTNPYSVKGADGSDSGIYGFHQLPTLIKQFGLLEYFDSSAKATYYYSPNTGFFFSCDNEKSVAEKGKYVKEKKLGGLVSWMASYDPNNVITRAMFNSLYGEDYKFPERDLFYNLISISAKIDTIENGYSFKIQNNAITGETNNALKRAEIFRKYILNLKIYITTKSGAKFGEGSLSGTVTNENGEIIIDPSSNPESRVVLPNFNGYFFNVTVSGTPNVDDIETISVSQRILPSLREIKKRIIYDKR